MEPVTILTFNEPEQAQPICRRLEQAGFHPDVYDERKRQKFWFTPNSLAGIRVRVDKHEYERAEKVLEQWETNEPDLLRDAIHCPECGSSEIDYPQFNRQFKLEPAVYAALSAIGLFEKKFYCHHCHHTWPTSQKLEAHTDVLGWPDKPKQESRRDIGTTP